MTTPSAPSARRRARAQFQIIPGFDSRLISRFEAFLAANDIEVTACQFIFGLNGKAEAAASISRMGALAYNLGDELAAVYAAPKAA